MLDLFLERKIHILWNYILYNISNSGNIGSQRQHITSSIRSKSLWKTRGANPRWSMVKFSPNKALVGPQIVYVFPLPVWSIQFPSHIKYYWDMWHVKHKKEHLKCAGQNIWSVQAHLTHSRKISRPTLPAHKQILSC